MPKYTIKELEQITGIKAHTIRIWEQRYNILNPTRTKTNIRYYTNNDLKKVLNIAFLKENGIKISKIAKLSDDEISTQVLKFSNVKCDSTNIINTLTTTLVDMDEEQFEKTINTCILRHGFEDCVVKVLYPFLRRIGIMWMAGSINPAQEHFMTNLIRQKLIVAVDGHINPSGKGVKKYLLFCPEGEQHELNLLFSAYILKSRHNRVIYLGCSVPENDLRGVCDIHSPEFMVCSITTTPCAEDIQSYINKLSVQFPDVKIIYLGINIEKANVNVPDNSFVFNNVDEFLSFVEKNKSDSDL